MSEGASEARPANHLRGQTSPYLLQHVHNPVDWYPWGEEALVRARAEDKPIFLSIGYAACHWCHVMERESFEDPRTAELLNRSFVAIKVDREERPDIDEIYMTAVQLMTSHGGWPLSVFLTPDLEPFMGGTYFPPEPRHGMPAFPTVLERVRDAWNERRTEIDRSAAGLAERLREIAAGSRPPAGGPGVGRRDVARAAAELTARFDSRWGGFGGAPKFPAEGALALLLDEHARSGEPVPLDVAAATLEAMARGGIYDHVGGGFARYAVDERWLVPHFEKMLYNQALLIPVYVDAFLLTGRPLFRRVVEQSLDFVRREMTSPHGGCYSSLDADSEGEEGKYYVWTPAEVHDLLGDEDGAFYCETYGISRGGNFEGKSIPNLLDGSLEDRAAAADIGEHELVARLEPLRARLLEARRQRVPPSTDDKLLTSWNGLMISAAARAHQALGRPADLATARDAARFVLDHLADGDRLRVGWRAGQARLNAYLDDYAFFARGLLDLYEACFEPQLLERATAFAWTILESFEDRDGGGFFFTSHDHELLLARNRSLHDGALPSGAGIAAELLLRLALHTGEERFRGAAERALAAAATVVERAPSACAATLWAAAWAEQPPPEVAIVGAADEEPTQALLRVVHGRYRSRPAVQVGPATAEPGVRRLLDGKRSIDGRATAWVCRNYACHDPVTEPLELARRLGDPPAGRG